MYFIFFGSYAYNRVYSSKNILFYDNEEQPEITGQQLNKPPFE